MHAELVRPVYVSSIYTGQLVGVWRRELRANDPDKLSMALREFIRNYLRVFVSVGLRVRAIGIVPEFYEGCVGFGENQRVGNLGAVVKANGCVFVSENVQGLENNLVCVNIDTAILCKTNRKT